MDRAVVAPNYGLVVGPDQSLGGAKVLTITLDTIHGRLAARAVAYSLLAVGEDALAQAIFQVVGEDG